MLIQRDDISICGYADNNSDSIQQLKKKQADLIIADIRLKDGLSIDTIKTLETNIPILFVTAYDQFAIKALNMGAVAYLLKPIDEAELNTSINKVQERQETFNLSPQQKDILFQNYEQPNLRKLALKSIDYVNIIDFDEILYAHSDKCYTTFQLTNGKEIMVSKLLKDYDTLLPTPEFYRCHQSYIIQLRYIKKYYKEGSIEVISGATIPVSKRKKSFLQEYIKTIS